MMLKICLSLIICSLILINNLPARQATLPAKAVEIATREGSGTEEFSPGCDTPSAQPRYIAIGIITATSVSGGIEVAADADGNLVVISTNRNPGFVPATGANYTVGSTVGNVKVVKAGPGTSFLATGLNASTNYYVYVFSMRNNCPGGTIYRSYNPAAVLVHTEAVGSGN